jgi:hypothetical protein
MVGITGRAARAGKLSPWAVVTYILGAIQHADLREWVAQAR